MKKASLRLLLTGTLGYVVLCTALYLLQDNLLYFPRDRAITDDRYTLLIPTDAGNTLITSDIKSTGKAILYFGGNAEDVSVNLSAFQRTFPDYSLYLMHYRGYGGSDGSPAEEPIYRDASALYDLVSNNNREIVLIGRSLGSGVATRLAAHKQPSQLILITPYSSIEDVASERYWIFPVPWLIKDKYLSWRYAQSVTATTSILVADNDTVIPNSSTLKLYDHFPQGLATLHAFENAGHNSISADPKYYRLLDEITRRKQ
ncbi:lysophospholipase [Aestuariirhabdus sp. Z084]|uniref:alpha/beta hydrolase n=1 Tax=Aestuariirhabdus haliotis TaxID=2918751 RepID=UPI00201B3B4F|nr:alpha/beta hydrolase [Aestuariirhabdus haliotis]MCL6417703.1 lysophospholipase [Aestuariirhabdus haliotis]MCL6421640.1 lysophospholipase [Aestuariirhabdus haliotis]